MSHSKSEHFFQPLLPGFENELSIPISFLDNLRGKKCEKALLRSSFGTKRDWHVKINGGRFEDGWKEFAKYHELHVGDFLVFRYEGDLVFDVMVFDPSCCEREYNNFVDVKQEIETSSSSEEEETEVANESDLRALKKQKQVKITVPEEKVDSYVPENPYFLVNLTAYGATSSKKNIPRKFARENGLRNRHCEILLVDVKGRSWVAEINYKKSDGQDYIGKGWSAFCSANDLKGGDTFYLELTRKGDKPVFRMTRLKRFLKTEKYGSSSTKNPQSSATAKATYRKNRQPKTPRDFARRNSLTKRHAKMILTNEEIEAAKISDLRELEKQKQVKITIPEEKMDSYVPENPYFLVNLTAFDASSCNKKHIPRKFAMENGLRNRHGEILLIDEEGRSWVAEQKYRKSNGQDYIGNGWRTFCTANYLKEGDTFFLELTHNRNKPVFKMTRLKRFLKTEKDGSSSTKNPQSSATVKATYGKNGQPKIPRDFARRNNLARRHAKMILTNEGGRSWLVSLVKDKSRGIHIGHGWSVFAAANGIREGDDFMLQLVKVGHMPVVRIYGVKRAKKRNMENNQTGSLEDFEDVKGIIVKDVHSSRIEASSFSKPNQNSEEV